MTYEGEEQGGEEEVGADRQHHQQKADRRRVAVMGLRERSRQAARGISAEPWVWW